MTPALRRLRFGDDPMVNPKAIYLFGYGLGGSVALYTAALEPKVAGVVCVAGFTPMRTDTAAMGTGGIARFAIDRPLAPRLGFFIGSESRIPYDFDDILATIAPRPVYVVNPRYDRGANFQDVHAALGEAARVFRALRRRRSSPGRRTLGLRPPVEHDAERIIKWMRENMKSVRGSMLCVSCRCDSSNPYAAQILEASNESPFSHRLRRPFRVIGIFRRRAAAKMRRW